MTAPARALAIAVVLSAVLSACGPRTVVRIGGGGDVTREVAEGRGAEAAYARAAADAHARTPRAWLWRVEGCAEVPSHVLGTMHVGVRFGDALPAPLDRALYDARSVLLEIDFRAIDTVSIWREVARTPPPTVESVLSAGELELLFRAVGDRVPEATLRRASPGRVADYLYDVRMAEAEAAAEGREPVPGAMTTARLDQSIASWAISMGRPFLGLETLDERLAILDGIYPPGAEVPGLLQLVADAEGTRAAAARGRAAYLALDEAAMRGHVDEMPVLERAALLVNRNLLSGIRASSPRSAPAARSPRLGSRICSSTKAACSRSSRSPAAPRAACSATATSSRAILRPSSSRTEAWRVSRARWRRPTAPSTGSAWASPPWGRRSPPRDPGGSARPGERRRTCRGRS